MLPYAIKQKQRDMITTVIISSVTASGSGFGMAFGLVAVTALIAFLCVKELAFSGESGSRRLLAQSLDLAIIPLIIVFAMILVTRTMEILA